MPSVLAILPEYSPSAMINVVAPFKYLHEHGKAHITIRLENDVLPTEVAQADLIVLCRNAVPYYKPIYEWAIELGIPIIYDLDDHLLGAPKGSYTEQYFQHQGRRDHYEWLLRNVRLIRVHSPTLQEVVRAYNDNVQVRWASIDWSLVPVSLPVIRMPLHLIYAAQPASGETLFPPIQPAIEQILARYGSRVHMHFLGYNPPTLCGHPSVTCSPFDDDYQAFFKRLTSYGYAIGLAPMIDDVFHNAKTNIKFRDYAAAGIAGVYADTPLYRNNGVVDGETGLLVSRDPQAWFAAIERLILNPSLLENIRQNARQFVETQYAQEIVSEIWLADFASLPPRPPLSESSVAKAEAMSWAFTGRRQTDKPWAAWLRRYLRALVPMKWKLRYYDLVNEIRQRRAR